MKRIPKKALEVLVRHAMADIGYGWGGSFGGGNEDAKNGGINQGEVKDAQRAIVWIVEELIKPKK